MRYFTSTCGILSMLKGLSVFNTETRVEQTEHFRDFTYERSLLVHDMMSEVFVWSPCAPQLRHIVRGSQNVISAWSMPKAEGDVAQSQILPFLSKQLPLSVQIWSGSWRLGSKSAKHMFIQQRVPCGLYPVCSGQDGKVSVGRPSSEADHQISRREEQPCWSLLSLHRLIFMEFLFMLR